MEKTDISEKNYQEAVHIWNETKSKKKVIQFLGDNELSKEYFNNFIENS